MKKLFKLRGELDGTMSLILAVVGLGLGSFDLDCIDCRATSHT